MRLDETNQLNSLAVLKGPPTEGKPIQIGAVAAKTELSKLLRQTPAGKRFINAQAIKADAIALTDDVRWRNYPVKVDF